MVLAAQDFSKISPHKKGEMEHHQPKHEPYVDAEPVKVNVAHDNVAHKEPDTSYQIEIAYPAWKRCAWILSGILTVGLAFLLYKRGSDVLVDAFADTFFLVPRHLREQQNQEQLKHGKK